MKTFKEEFIKQLERVNEDYYIIEEEGNSEVIKVLNYDHDIVTFWFTDEGDLKDIL